MATQITKGQLQAMLENIQGKTEITVTVKGDKVQEDIRSAFDLTILKAGNYQFTVTEQMDNVPDGWEYDTAMYTVT